MFRRVVVSLAVSFSVLFACVRPASAQIRVRDFDPCRAYYCDYRSYDMAVCIVDLRGIRGQWSDCDTRMYCMPSSEYGGSMMCNADCYGTSCMYV